MNLTLTGVNFDSAPLVVREKLGTDSSRLPKALDFLKSSGYSGVILSTCNRTEVYTTPKDNSLPSQDFFNNYFSSSQYIFRPYLYTLTDEAAVSHLFSVTAGLESMVLGESEILGQVSRALKAAEEAGTANRLLKQLFISAIQAGRRVRQETRISEGSISVSALAVDHASKSFPNFTQRHIVIIGAGEAGRTVAKVAHKKGATQITLLSHNPDAASVVANELGISCCSFDRLEEELSSADIVFTCSMAPHWVITKEQASHIMDRRPERTLLLIDIAVPRNIEPSVDKIQNILLFNIDDLKELADSNRTAREAEISHAKDIIKEEEIAFGEWQQTFEATSAIKALTAKAEAYRRERLDKFLASSHSLTEEQKSELDMMTRSMIKKILHDPIEKLKESPENYKEALAELFRLDIEA